ADGHQAAGRAHAVGRRERGTSGPHRMSQITSHLRDPPATYAPSTQTLDACVLRCGKRFQAEVGKFRFLNEMIKMLSPKVCDPPRTCRHVADRVQLSDSTSRTTHPSECACVSPNS